eukprot:48346-Chlamydomonas_euryale.AAC.1
MQPFSYSGPLAVAFAESLLSPEGQALLSASDGLAPLPETTRSAALSALDRISLDPKASRWTTEPATASGSDGTLLFSFSAHRSSGAADALAALARRVDALAAAA